MALALMTCPQDGVKVDSRRNCSSIWVLSILRRQLVKEVLVVKRAMLFLEGLLLFKHLREMLIGTVVARRFKAGSYVVLFVDPG